MTFAEGDFANSPEGYSWPTAEVVVETIYDITAFDSDGNEITVLQVVVVGLAGEFTYWNIIS